MAHRENRNNQPENDAWAKRHLGALRARLVPSAPFYAQTKAEIFRKIAADKQHHTAWSNVSHGVRKWVGVITSAAVLAGALFSAPIFSPKVTLAYVGEFNTIEGDVFIHRAEGTVRAQSNDKIFEGDTIEVASASKAQITLAGDARAELTQNTKIRVSDVVNMRVDDTIVSSQVHLELEKGTYVQKKSDPVTETPPTVITLATPSGTIKASAYADYEVNADNVDQIALSVHANGVTVLKDGADTNQTDGQVIREGQTVVMDQTAENGIVYVADPVTSTGTVIATTEAPAATRSATSAVTRTTRDESAPAGQSATPTMTAPQASSMDLAFKDTLLKLQPRLDIAQVKMDQVISLYSKGDTSDAMNALSGYVSTVTDISRSLTGQETNQGSPAGTSPSMDQIVSKSPLSSAYTDLTAMAGVDKTSDEYRKTLESLEILSRAEAALRMDIASKDVPSAAKTAAPMAMAMTNQNADAAPEQTDTRTYIKKVQTDVISQVQDIINDTDAKRASTDFVALLARIPDEARNIPLLERIGVMVPESLRGFVSVKIHRIQYPEAK